MDDFFSQLSLVNSQNALEATQGQMDDFFSQLSLDNSHKMLRFCRNQLWPNGSVLWTSMSFS